MDPGSAAESIPARARRVIPGGVNSANRWGQGLEGMAVASASGATFACADGRTFVDYHGAGGPSVLGHCREEVDRAAAGAARSLDLVGVACTELEVRLAERVVGLVPSAEQVLLTNSGSEATYHAVRLARAATGRRLLVKFEGCYHGWHDAVALNLVTRPDRIGLPDPLSAGSMEAVLAATLVLPFNDPAAVTRAFEVHGDDIAAVIVEPVAHNVGALLPVPGFLERLRELCTRHGSVLIFDEVITGFRHALGGYQEICGVTPDVTTLGKAMANGYPIGAVAGRADLMERFSTNPAGDVFFAGTYNGHPAMVAAALETLRILEDEPVHEHLFRLGDLARAGLRRAMDRTGVPSIMAGFGSVFVTYFMEGEARTYADLVRNDERLFCGYRRELMPHGIFQFPRNLKRNHISAAHTEADIDRLIEATEPAVGAVLAQPGMS